MILPTHMSPEVAAERLLSALRQKQWSDAQDIMAAYPVQKAYLFRMESLEIIHQLWESMPEDIKDMLLNFDDHIRPQIKA
jgi:hypothetical protein